MEYKDKEEFRDKETGKIKYDAYFYTDKTKLTKQDLCDIADDINDKVFKDKIKYYVNKMYYWFNQYIYCIETDNLVEQFLIYGRIVEMHENFRMKSFFAEEFDRDLKSQYPEFLEDTDKIKEYWINNHCKTFEEIGADEVFQYSVFKFTKDIMHICRKYTKYQPLTDYFDRNLGVVY
jgi:hypothetical protein